MCTDGYGASDIQYSWKPSKDAPFAYPSTFNSPNIEIGGYKAANATVSLSSGNEFTSYNERH